MHRRAAALWVVVAVTTVGCTTPIQFSPPSAELREQLGVVRLSYRQDLTRPSIEAPIEGKDQGAASGARDGARAVMGWGHEMCVGTIEDGFPISLISPAHLFACVGWEALGVALTPLGVAVGATVGAIRSRSGEDVESAQRALEDAVADGDPTETLVALIEAKAQQRDLPIYADHTQPFLPWEDLPLLHKEGVETSLSVEVEVDIHAKGKYDPTLEVLSTARAQIARARDGMILYERKWLYQGEKRSYFDFAEEGGDPLRAEIQQSLERLAETIVGDLFVSTEIETDRGLIRGEVVTFDAWQHPDYEVAE